MAHFKTAASNGVLETFVTMGVIYFMFMMIGVYAARVPAADWKPAGWIAPAQPKRLVTTADVGGGYGLAYTAILAAVGRAVHERDRGHRRARSGLADDPGNLHRPSAAGPAAAGFVGLISLFDMAGRFFWATASDYIGRRNTYMVFFLLGILLYSDDTDDRPARLHPLFVAAFCVILSMYGGGFAAIPAYLRDIFGNHQVAAIQAGC